MINTVLPTRKHIDGLDTGHEQLGSGGAFHQRNRLGVNGPPFGLPEHRLAVDGFAKNVKHAAQHHLAHRDP
jgi:hypothetical protein